MGGVNLRLLVNCLYDLVIDNFGLSNREFTQGIRDIRTIHCHIQCVYTIRFKNRNKVCGCMREYKDEVICF